MPRITLEDLIRIDYEYVTRRITDFIRSYIRDAGASGAVIGLSGGVDSSVTAYLLVRALGPESVVGLIMPYRTTPPEDIRDAEYVAGQLGIKYYYIDIGDIRNSFARSIPIFSEEDRISAGNLLPRIRMTLLYYFANRLNMIVVGTGDKSELLIGYFTKYGDGGVDILPIGDLYKTQVRYLGKYLGLPDNIAFKPSSPRLWEDQTAEGELGFKYEDVDVILAALVDYRMTPEQAAEATGKPLDLVRLVWRRVLNTEHKRRTPIVPRVSMRTLGIDWRMPVNKTGLSNP
ncbi:NAD+ synthase [Vulcanisaeta thermophila]|uniref:NAD+ synthase n=1 Tax=Vulcanisaeta thermophila TaxID=867917 RepID=UPI000853462B|nr:NAD+ synthase [Vulcanisaeta thermophila]